MTQKANRGRVEGPAAPDHHAVNPRRRLATGSGFGWAEPEMAYQEAPSALVMSTDLKAALRGYTSPPPPSVMDQGAKLDMVQSRELMAVIRMGLAGAFGQLLATRVPKWAFTSPHWFTVPRTPVATV